MSDMALNENHITVQVPQIANTSATALRSSGYGSPETSMQVKAMAGPSQHGRDIPAAGLPGPAAQDLVQPDLVQPVRVQPVGHGQPAAPAELAKETS